MTALTQTHPPVLTAVWRGEMMESGHRGHVVVTDSTGKQIAHTGDPEVVTYLRSSAKPIQAIGLVETGAADYFGLSQRELAVVAASHNGAPIHVETVLGILARAGLSEHDLQCGTHMPFDKQSVAQLKAQNLAPTPVYNNCSGKHTGMLLLAKFLAAPLETYLDPEHPVQRMIRANLSFLTGLRDNEITLGTDGCSAPTFALPLKNFALAVARLMQPEGLPAAKAAACRRIADAMQAYSEMVAGEGEWDTVVMRTFQGKRRLLSKGGAEGYQIMGIGGDSAEPALGIALKIEDGNAQRARDPATAEVLRQLGLLDAASEAALAEFSQAEVRNRRNLLVGRVKPALTLEWD